MDTPEKDLGLDSGARRNGGDGARSGRKNRNDANGNMVLIAVEEEYSLRNVAKSAKKMRN